MNGLRKIRKEKGLTLKQVSKEVNLSVAVLSRYERGERFPKKKALEQLAKFFECTIDDLM